MVAEDDRDEGDRDAQEDERSEHEREVVVMDVASNVDDGEEEEDVENDGNAESERAEGQREIDEGLHIHILFLCSMVSVNKLNRKMQK